MLNPSALEHVALMDAGARAAADSGAPLSSPILDVPTGCGALQSSWFSLDEAFLPIPEKLVRHIQLLDYVDLAELLPDNMELQRLADTESRHGSGQWQPRWVNSLITWVQCFVTYATMVAEAHPHRMRNLMAYLRMIVRQAQRHGGDGWRSYDVLFRKIAAANSALRWGQPLPSLYPTPFLAARASAAASCENCGKRDHRSKECTLSPVTASLPKAVVLSKARFTSRLGGHRRRVQVVLLVLVLQTARSARNGILVQVDVRATRHVRTSTLACAAASAAIK